MPCPPVRSEAVSSYSQLGILQLVEITGDFQSQFLGVLFIMKICHGQMLPNICPAEFSVPVARCTHATEKNEGPNCQVTILNQWRLLTLQRYTNYYDKYYPFCLGKLPRASAF